MQEQKPETNTIDNKTLTQVVSKISTSENILIALSQNPSADELAAAIGLSVFLDKAGKHATAIYSGKTPSILEFLEPEERLEANTDSLQDFIIALNKNKADHLHYKVDGDYVKIYITPYKTKISEEDFEFSHGDFNIGLVIALNVTNENSLDQALTSHGRILHDAEIINITTSAPGDFGGIQWSDPAASSVSEMVAELAFSIQNEIGVDVDGEVSTALLTGVFVATERFSNNRTQPETMNMAARLMEVGANQQLISEYLKKAEKDEGEEISTQNNQDENTPSQESNESKETDNTLVIQQGEQGNAEDVKQNEYVRGAHTENQPGSDEQRSIQNTPDQNNGSLTKDRPILEEKSGFEKAEVVEMPMNNERPVLKPLGKDYGSQEPGPSVQSVPVNLAPLSQAEASGNIMNEGLNTDLNLKPGIGQMDTPFEETPAPAFADEKGDAMVGAPAPQPVANSENDLSALSSLGAKSSVDESVMNELRNLPDESGNTTEAPAPLGKDYSNIPAPSQANGEREFLNDNPASMAAPGVNEGPEENHIPGLDFNNPVNMSEDEPSLANNSYIIEPSSEPSAQETPSVTLEPKPQGMPLPGEEILPPPPTPPVDFGAIKAEDAIQQPEPVVSQPANSIQTAEPVVAQNPVVQQPEPVVNQGFGLPQVDPNILGNENIAAPTSFQQPEPTVTPVAPVAPAAPANDPSAFKIPGT